MSDIPVEDYGSNLSSKLNSKIIEIEKSINKLNGILFFKNHIIR